MPVPEMPNLVIIVIEIVIGVITGNRIEKLKQATALASAFSFIAGFGSYFLAYPNDLNALTANELNAKITVMMYALVNFLLHAIWFELGTFPSNLISHRDNRY